MIFCVVIWNATYPTLPKEGLKKKIIKEYIR
jgi:hypothetical protein